MPLVIKGIPSEKTTQQFDEEKRERDTKTALDRELTKYTGWQARLTFGLMIVAVFQLGFFYWQLMMMGRSLLDAKTSAQAALKTAESIVTAERAYVKISHAPPGIIFLAAVGPAVNLRIENFGRTPSRVTDVVVTFKAYPMRSDIPATPDYSGAREGSVQAFLVPGDFFNVGRNSPFDEARANNFRGRIERLIVLGFVDYIDQFGQRNRAGYARQFNPLMDMRDTYGTDDAFAQRSNLVLVTEPGYNYDRRRLPGEGRDWNEAN